MELTKKNILLGITGSIAAYKSAELVSRLRKVGANVRVVMTKNSHQFITATTMLTLSGNPVRTDMFADDLNLEHIELARWADVILVAPASANFIAHLAHGFANDLLTTICVATRAKIIVAPAMNVEMWKNKITQKNIGHLNQHNIEIFGPETGTQACGEVGVGRMIEPQAIMQKFNLLFPTKKMNKKILITAGPTYEPIDPVRFIGNHSSGKMGFALAKAAINLGTEVTLIAGPTNLPTPKSVKRINITTAQEMHDAVMQNINNVDIFISVAAVSDYRPANPQKNKIKKSQQTLNINLEATPDILATVTNMPNPPFTIGFAAETENVIENTRKKLRDKKPDVIIANQVGNNIGFNADKIAVTICKKNGKIIKLPLQSKTDAAKQILTHLID
ncbi:MAG: bifunctional phosphopantothenoylcysteine decarboxylase/phosphopantothenate--cysteine ligase CoaBC [Gammaproteobacteria bacterium]|jgi:phosphopantothenoylcysteine decarboxylase/phosphopantothenate--cysteine ligase